MVEFNVEDKSKKEIGPVPCFANDILQIDSRHVNEQVVAMIENINVTDYIRI